MEAARAYPARHMASPRWVIVCEDGTSDAPEDALAPYRAGIVPARRSHSGQASAKNSAAARASGDLVMVDRESLR